jgi:hypothetical protein
MAAADDVGAAVDERGSADFRDVSAETRLCVQLLGTAASMLVENLPAI